MASDPIPLLLCGKIPTHVAAVTEAIKPKFRVIHSCSNIAAATAFLSSTMGPDSTAEKPQVVVMGGGYSPEEFETARAIEGATSVPWLRVRPGNKAAGPPPQDVVVGQTLKCLDEHYEEILRGQAAGQVWWYGMGN